MPDPSVSPLPPPMRVSYAGAPRGPVPDTGMILLGAPWLAGEANDALFNGVAATGAEHGLTLFHGDGLLVGYGRAQLAGGDAMEASRDLYRRVLTVTRGRHLYRVWNYVPQINATDGGLERYRAFCQGRSTAFEESYGVGFPQELSAASAVGSDGGALELIFIAGGPAGRHVENPEQIPAYQYPPEHGPRPPSFARATVVAGIRRTYTFVSGTAAIKGHATVAPGRLADQLACTLDNLRLISREVAAGEQLDPGPGGERHFKVYLRHAADLPATQAFLGRELLRAADQVTYLRADICRAALNVEIEATLVR